MSKTETTSRNDIGIELKKDGEDSSGGSIKPHIRFQEKEYHVNYCKRLHYSDPSRAREGMGPYRGPGANPDGCCCVVS